MSNGNISIKPKKARKVLVIGVLFFALFIGLWWGVPTYRKAKADAMVTELCAKDGGSKVYEVVRLPAEKFGLHGNVIFSGNKHLPPLRKQAKPNDEFYFTSETEWIIPDSGFNSLVVWRSHQKLFRTVDDKLLGESISYSRRGGDPMGPWHPSSFGCPSDADVAYLVRKVFVRG